MQLSSTVQAPPSKRNHRVEPPSTTKNKMELNSRAQSRLKHRGQRALSRPWEFKLKESKKRPTQKVPGATGALVPVIGASLRYLLAKTKRRGGRLWPSAILVLSSRAPPPPWLCCPGARPASSKNVYLALKCPSNITKL